MTKSDLMAGGSVLPVSMFHAPAGAPMMMRGPVVPRAPETDAGGGGEASDGGLSIDAAVGALNALAPDEGDDEQENEASAQLADDADAPGDDLAGDGDEDADQGEPGDPAVEPPHFWAAEDKEAFAQLPAALQKAVTENDAKREQYVSSVIEQTANVRKQLTAEMETVQAVKTRLETALPEAEQMFAVRWSAEDGSPPDWLEIAKEFGTDAAEVLKGQFAADTAALKAIREAAAQTEKTALEHHMQTEAAAIATKVPDLADRARGPALRAKLSSFLRSEGYSTDELNWAGARDYSIAYDAMRWRELQSGMSGKAQGDNAQPTPGKATTLRPSATPNVRGSQKREAIQRRDRFQKSGSIDDAVAYLSTRN